MMLQQIDEIGVFSQLEEKGVLFLLLDGHGSRTRLLFLEYITKPETQVGGIYRCPIGDAHMASA